MPAEFRFPASDTALWLPLKLDPAKTDSATVEYFSRILALQRLATTEPSRLSGQSKWVIIMTMIIVNIHDAKARLSEYLEAVGRGERVVICKRNRPVAELRAVASARDTPRPLGGAQGTLDVPASFFEPLPDDVIEAFDGTTAPPANASRVAEAAPPPYDTPSTRRGRRRR